MELLDRYFALQAEIFAYFGYVEDWRVIPLDDLTKTAVRMLRCWPATRSTGEREHSVGISTR